MTTAQELHRATPPNLVPSRVLERAEALGMQAFVLRPEFRHLLLVRLSSQEPQLRGELERAFGVGVAPASAPSTVVDLTAYTDFTMLGQEPVEGALGVRKLGAWIAFRRCIAVPLVERREPRDGHIVVGRSREVDLCLRRQSVSKQHARFSVEAGGNLWLQDLGSRNGTYLDQQQQHARVLVMPGSQLRFGRTECLYTTPDLFWRLIHDGV